MHTRARDVYLDNGDGKPQGSNEIVTHNLDGEFSPKRPEQSFSQMFVDRWAEKTLDMPYDAPATGRGAYVAATKKCRAQLVARGVDLGAYNTLESSNDLVGCAPSIGPDLPEDHAQPPHHGAARSGEEAPGPRPRAAHPAPIAGARQGSAASAGSAGRRRTGGRSPSRAAAVALAARRRPRGWAGAARRWSPGPRRRGRGSRCRSGPASWGPARGSPPPAGSRPRIRRRRPSRRQKSSRCRTAR